MRAQHLAGPALIAAALLAAIPLAQSRSGAQSQGPVASAQPDQRSPGDPAVP